MQGVSLTVSDSVYILKQKKPEEFGQQGHMGSLMHKQVPGTPQPSFCKGTIYSSPGKPGCVTRSSADGEFVIGAPCVPDPL